MKGPDRHGRGHGTFYQPPRLPEPAPSVHQCEVRAPEVWVASLCYKISKFSIENETQRNNKETPSQCQPPACPSCFISCFLFICVSITRHNSLSGNPLPSKAFDHLGTLCQVDKDLPDNSFYTVASYPSSHDGSYTWVRPLVVTFQIQPFPLPRSWGKEEGEMSMQIRNQNG